MKNFRDPFIIDKNIASEVQFNPYYKEINSGISHPCINDRSYIDLASNNYLGLATDERVKQAVCQAVNTFGVSMCGTPIATGYVSLFRKAEEDMAGFVGLESSLLFPSCYQANSSLFTALTTPEDILIIDHYAHSSLGQGVRATRCKIKPFLHNDMTHLEKLLKTTTRNEKNQIYVVTESVFSTDGSIAPCREIVNLCSRYEAVPIIDDSHGIGVLGKNGRGILEACGLSDYRGIYTASLGKALATNGGIIAGSHKLIDFLKYSCTGLIYSTALAPGILGGLLEVIRIIKNDFPLISEKIWTYKRMISETLVSCDIKISAGDAPITAILSGSVRNTFTMAKQLFTQGILTTPFIPPSVPANQGKVRLIAGAALHNEDIESICTTLQRLTPSR